MKVSVIKMNISGDYTILYDKAETDEIFRELEQEVYVVFYWCTGQGPTIWKVAQRSQEAGNLQRCWTDIHLLWPYIDTKALDSSSRACSTSDLPGDRADLQLCAHWQVQRWLWSHPGTQGWWKRPGSPFTSVSFEACRDFLFQHKDSRGKRPRQTVEVVKLQLAHGSLLMMNHCTNTHWYHSLPIRKKVLAPRGNLTFQKILPTKK